MLTRGHVLHQPGHQHVIPPAPEFPRARLYGAGGLLGGAVTLTARGLVGQSRGNTGYGYLGMDPSDPMTWPRPFVPTSGMISYLNYGVTG
jgi:hypothetical protein